MELEEKMEIRVGDKVKVVNGCSRYIYLSGVVTDKYIGSWGRSLSSIKFPNGETVCGFGDYEIERDYKFEIGDMVKITEGYFVGRYGTIVDRRIIGSNRNYLYSYSLRVIGSVNELNFIEDKLEEARELDSREAYDNVFNEFYGSWVKPDEYALSIGLNKKGRKVKKKDMGNKFINYSDLFNTAHLWNPFEYWENTNYGSKLLNQIKAVYVNTKKLQVIIKWSDGTETKSTCEAGDEFDLKLGFIIALQRKLFKSDKKLVKFIEEKLNKEQKGFINATGFKHEVDEDGNKFVRVTTKGEDIIKWKKKDKKNVGDTEVAVDNETETKEDKE